MSYCRCGHEEDIHVTGSGTGAESMTGSCRVSGCRCRTYTKKITTLGRTRSSN